MSDKLVETKSVADQKISAATVAAAMAAPPAILRYREGRAFVAQVLILALSPLWLLYAAYAVVNLLYEAVVIAAAGQVGTEHLLLPAAFYLALIASGYLALKVCSDTRLVLDSAKIRLPLYLLFESRFCVERSWQSLVSLQFKGAGAQSKPQSLVLRFGDGAAVRLALNAISQEHLKELIMAVQVFAPHVQFSPSLRQLDLNLNQTTGGLLALPASFTELWEQDLADRFRSTIFVPLEPGQELCWGRTTAMPEPTDLTDQVDTTSQAKAPERRLKVLAQLAFGGLSAVYLVQPLSEGILDFGVDSVLVLKEAVLPANADEKLESKALEMFQREARLISSLSHPRVARVVDYFVSRGRNYILLEHIEGTDLRRFIGDHGPQPAAVVLRWYLELLDIVEYLHSHKPPVVHRDLTPDNIILARDGHLSVIDFGAANTLVGTATGTVVGKQAYIAPEQFRGKAVCGSDLYALAATMGFALTGRDPEPLSVSSPRLVNRSVAEQLDNLIMRCTAQEMENRLTDIGEIRTCLAAASKSIREAGS